MKLLVIEGLDGSGKSTQIELLKSFLSEKGLISEFLHFPRTDAPFFGELIARFLRGEFGSIDTVDPWLVAMLYAGDRNDAAESIRNWLNESKVVILDRYTYSNIAYQCAKLNNTDDQAKLMEWIIDLEFRHFGIPVPDLNIFLDVPFSFTEKKLSSDRSGNDRDYLNGTKDIHEESLSFQKKVREVYLKVAATDKRLHIIDCSNGNDKVLPPGIISQKIIDTLYKLNII